MSSDLTLDPSFKVKQGWPNLKVLKSQCQTNLKDIMGWESSDVVTFDLWPLLQGQMMVHWLW